MCKWVTDRYRYRSRCLQKFIAAGPQKKRRRGAGTKRILTGIFCYVSGYTVQAGFNTVLFKGNKSAYHTDIPG